MIPDQESESPMVKKSQTESDFSSETKDYMKKALEPVKDWDVWVDEMGKTIPSISSEMVYVQQIKLMMKANAVFLTIGGLMVVTIMLWSI